MIKKVLFALAFLYAFVANLAMTQNTPSAPGKLVDIGGYKLHINGTGQGTPTVILDACLGGNYLYWSLVQPEVEKFAHVCSYDRAGLGFSDESPDDRSSQHISEELHKLLQISGIPAPYILVGHSSGGINMRLYANMYPDEVYGVILVDASHEDQLETFEDIDARFPITHTLMQKARTRFINSSFYQACLRGLRACHLLSPQVALLSPDAVFTEPTKTIIEFLESLPKAKKADHDEWVYFKNSMQQLKNSNNQLLDKPLIVITACKKREDRVPQEEKARMHEYDTAWMKFQQDFLSKSHQSMQMFAEKSGHFVMCEQPEIIIQAIRCMVEKYRMAL